MKKFIGFIGLGIIGGVAVCVFLSKKKNESSDVVYDENICIPENFIVPENPIVYEAMTEVNDRVDADKSFAVDTIAARHAEAAEIIKSSMEVIIKKDNTNEMTSNKLDEISEELDNLLSEV